MTTPLRASALALALLAGCPSTPTSPDAPADGARADVGGTTDAPMGEMLDAPGIPGDAPLDAPTVDAPTVDAPSGALGAVECAGASLTPHLREFSVDIAYRVGAGASGPILSVSATQTDPFIMSQSLMRVGVWETPTPFLVYDLLPIDGGGHLFAGSAGYQTVDALGHLGPEFTDPALVDFYPMVLRREGANVVAPWLRISRIVESQLLFVRATTTDITSVTRLILGVPIDTRGRIVADVTPDSVLVIQDHQFWRFPLSSLSTPFTHVEPAGTAWPALSLSAAWDATRALWVVIGQPTELPDEVHAYFIDPQTGLVVEEHALATGRAPVCQVVATARGVAFVCADSEGGGAVYPFEEIQIAFAEPTLTPFVPAFPAMPADYDLRAYPAVAWDESLDGVVITESLSGPFGFDRKSMIRLRCIHSVE